LATGPLPATGPPPATGPLPATGQPVATAPGVLPDSAFTPGATNPAVTPATIRHTICSSGWTATIRPPEAYTENLKRLEDRAGGVVTYLGVSYEVHGFELTDHYLSDFELDHLVPLEVGGSPADPRNLWLENRRQFPGPGEKDQLEDYLRRQVCSGTMTLVGAQKTIESNWVAAYCAARLSECSDGVHLMPAAVRPGIASGG
jgi:hypothetical protein